MDSIAAQKPITHSSQVKRWRLGSAPFRNPPDVALVVPATKAAGVFFIAYTTHSHLRVTGSNPLGEGRVRVVIPLLLPISADLYEDLWAWAEEKSGHTIDPQTKARGQMYYAPAIAEPGAPYQCHIGNGRLLDWRESGLSVGERPEQEALGVRCVEVEGDAADTFGADEKQAVILLAENWKNNHRHETSLALASMLLRAGWGRRRAEDFIRLVALSAFDEEVEDRVKCVATTVKRLQSGGKFTGLPRLSELAGGDVAGSLRELLRLQPISEEEKIGEPLSSADATAPLRALKKAATLAEIESALRDFSALPPSCDALSRELARDGAVKILKECGVSSPSRLVSAVLPKEGSGDEGESKSLDLKAPEPWGEPVNGEQLLADLVHALSRFLSASDGLLETVALWILYAHAFDAFDVSPILAITSPEKWCGKSTLLMLIDALVPKPLSVSNITPAALFRSIEKYRPTLLIDEADTFLTGNEDLRGIINSGHYRKTAAVIRTVGEDHDPQRFTTWAPKVIAMIGTPPGTVEDRAIVIRMQR